MEIIGYSVAVVVASVISSLVTQHLMLREIKNLAGTVGVMKDGTL